MTVTAPVPGIVDLVVPSIGQLVVGLDGMAVTVDGSEAILETAREVRGDDGVIRFEPSVEVRFDKGDLFTRTLRLAVRPEAAFFFLVAGLLLAGFEFYAAGAGVMAAVAVLSLLLAGYGLATLPLRWWAVAATLAGVGLYFAAFQRAVIGWRGLAGTALLGAGGWWFVDASPQLATVRWVVVLIVVGSALFVGIGMSAVTRARFSTTTIGRDHLIGKAGKAIGDLDPDGEVDVDGARWRASGHRAAGIRAGDAVAVVGVSGIVLEVEPAARDGVRD
jgi:membrane-bound ClpP family serine protease